VPNIEKLSILYVHDFAIGLDKDKIYSAVGLPESYFNRFFESGYDKVFLLSRSEEYTGQVGYVAFENKNILHLNPDKKGYFGLIPIIIANVLKFRRIAVNYPSVLGSITIILCVLFRKKFVVELAATNDLFKSKKFGLLFCAYLDCITKFFIRYACCVLSVSSSIIPNNVPEKKRYIASNVIISNMSSVRKHKPMRAQIKVGYCGALTYRKGIDRLIRCSEISGYMKLPLVFEASGGHADNEYMPDLMRSNIKLNGILEKYELSNFYQDIDVLLVLSRSEGLPRAVLEAMSFAVPVVGLELPGLSNVLHQSVMFSQKTHLSQVLKKIYTICSDEDEYVSLSYHSLRIASNYTDDKMSNVRELVYGKLLKI